MIKVLLVSSIFPNSAENERGIFTYHIAEALKSRCRLEVVAPLPWVPRPLKNRDPEKYLNAQVPVIENISGQRVHHPRYGAIPGFLNFLHPIFMFAPLLQLIKKLDRQEGIDVINAHWLFPDGVAATWVARRLGKPIVLTALGCDINYYPTLPFRKNMIQHALGLSKHVTVKAASLKQQVVALGVPANDVHIIPNGIDSHYFHIMDRISARRRLNLPENGLLILTVGSLDEVKGTRYLLEALKDTSGCSEPLPHLLLVGEGPLQSALTWQARDFGIAGRVHFLGKKPHHEIPLWMNAADLFCLPSIREGRPNVLLEALACGLPAVASSVGSIPEMINEKNGFLARAGSHESLKTQILAALNRNWDRKEICGTVEKFSWEECADQYIQIYLETMADYED